MCNSNTSVQSMTLQTAVLTQVQEFVNAGKSFSVFDLTTAIRNKCNSGTLEIPEVENSNPASQFRYDVRHDAVKAAFAELWDNSLQSGLPALTRQFTGRYFTYDGDTSVNPAPSPIQVVTGTPAVTPVTATVVSGPTQVTSPSPALSEAEVTRRIRIYLENCTKTGHVPSPKQVQSAIKRDRSTGYSYDKIIDAAKVLGYTLDVNV